ncbi:SusD-like starch-binding protein associating with outer membrane [Algoriphagus aquaeductus]|uniref:SusD-like starch-binding protein associating with outer membrane n=1 Tax=Algoriphagus aquaeductus TaxID=475299 RepID=A0A326RKV0_9BACT|nr:RagB/SusD family nutrient uptake outer membrane protein [Algoriphagus aquaeductus]PZV77565.1 SusD-like starch-binding protein associating with outer membrane [Algoriphagus aquaeductus]
MKNINYTIIAFALIVISGCTGFLDERPNKGILIPTTAEDIRALLDNDTDLNVVPAFGLLSSDDLVINDQGWGSLSSPSEQNAYIWNEEVWAGEASADWARLYRVIFVSNIALEQAELLPASEEVSKLKAEALFHRAHAHFMLAQVFSPAYFQGVTDQELGIPLRLNTEILERSPRIPLRDYYKVVINDLEIAFESLPMSEPLKTRPSKLTAKALLARVYLTMGMYDLAEEAANWILERPEVSLLNYQDLNPSTTYPFVVYNSEVIFNSVILSHSYASVGNVNVWINPELYQRYEEGDLRKVLFAIPRANGGISFKGQYTGRAARFGGIALDEMYFIKAECLARKNDSVGALKTLNDLLKTRYKVGSFSGFEGLSGINLLKKVLEEKRKSLVYRGINWIDLRRLNFEPAFQRTIERKISGVTYRLTPLSKKYVLPIPDNELNLNPIDQTDRRD